MSSFKKLLGTEPIAHFSVVNFASKVTSDSNCFHFRNITYIDLYIVY